jgi:hypothetical protein
VVATNTANKLQVILFGVLNRFGHKIGGGGLIVHQETTKQPNGLCGFPRRYTNRFQVFYNVHIKLHCIFRTKEVVEVVAATMYD